MNGRKGHESLTHSAVNTKTCCGIASNIWIWAAFKLF